MEVNNWRTLTLMLLSAGVPDGHATKLCPPQHRCNRHHLLRFQGASPTCFHTTLAHCFSKTVLSEYLHLDAPHTRT